MSIKHKKIIVASLLLAAASALLPGSVLAAADVPTATMLGGVFGDATLAQIIIRLIQLFLALLGIIAVGLLLYAGFNWMTAAGDASKVEKAKRIMQQVVIGLLVIVSAFAITSFIYDRFGPNGGVNGGTPGTGTGGTGTIEYWADYAPEITYVSPAKDVNGNTDAKTLLATQTSDDIANGAPGNVVSIIGRYFGTVRGKVYFISKSSNARIEASLAACANSWSSNLIVAVVPAGLTQAAASKEADVAAQNPLRNYDIIVVKDANTVAPLESNAWGFQVNKINRPGICSAAPDHGTYPATTTLSGYKFPTAAPRSIVWSISPNSVTSSGSQWSSSSAVSAIPQGLAGRALVSVFNGESYSNYLPFNISNGAVGDPCGFDTQSCREDISTCGNNQNLACQYCSSDPTKANYQANCDTSKNCTCQPQGAEACAYNSDPALNAQRACSTGGCSGTESCSSKGAWSRSCQLTDKTCVPFLGNTSSISAFSWAFSAFRSPSAGMSCKSAVWNDGSCDINGCLDAGLGCDAAATTEEWVELYNPTNSTIDLSNWALTYSDSAAGGATKTYANLTGSISGRGYTVISNPNLRLPSAGAMINLTDQSSQIDSVAYGTKGLSPAFSPASFGRKIDGLDTASSSDFIYFNNSSAGLSNNIKQSTSSSHLVINEVSLAHEACTCVPKSQLCVAGAVDATSCPTLGNCQQSRTCQDSGHYGACVQTNPSCIPYPLVPASTIAAYSWIFGANGNISDNGPMVVSACDGSTDCSKNRLPSPSPWNKWTKANAVLDNDKACLNAVIYARFSQKIDLATLNVANIRLFAYNAGNGSWEDKTDSYVKSVVPELSTGDTGADSFMLNLSVNLPASTNFRVYLNKKVRDELGRNLIDNPNGVSQDLCSEETGRGLPSDPGVCWSFITRPAGVDSICQIGCVNCSPNKYFNRYYGEETLHSVFPISLDNSCIMLNNRDYAWDWSQEQQSLGGGNWFTQSNVAQAYSWLTDPAAGINGIASQAARSIQAGNGTTTAYQESKWRTNSDYSSWFGPDDVDYFRIKGQVQATGHYGVCAAQNNFTDPVVIESQYCSRTSSSTNPELNKQVLQSPSPWKGQTDACTNAAIFVLFSRNMQDSTLLNSDGTVKNFEIYKCSDSKSATSTDFSGRASGCTVESGWTAKVFNYTHQNITLQDLIDAPTSAYGSLVPEGVEIVPPGKTELDANSWYKVVIKGGYGGVRGAATTTVGAEAAEGVLQVPSANARLINGAETWYYWYFKTGQGSCPIDQVAVLPQLKFMSAVGETQDYLADPYAANCNHLNPNLYSWKWDSLINPYADRCLADKSNPSSGDSVATICDKSDASCLAASEPDKSEVKAFSQSEGNTKITAAAVQGECVSNKWGAGQLQVGYGGFKVISSNSSDCLNTDIDVAFSQDANSSSILSNNNLSLFECPDKDCKTLDYSKQILVNPDYPSGSSNNPNPFYVNRLHAVPAKTLIPGKTYRAVVIGGAGGIRSAVNSGLTGLNFQSNANNGGEACDPSLYPWRPGDPESGLCKDSAAGQLGCTLQGNLCGTTSQECNPQKDALCDANCHKTGNANNLASCGNGKIEAGENCDDGNINSGDGCNSRCLLEGSSAKYNSVCGNKRVEKGEQCDDGNSINGDGCNSKCLKEDDASTGSSPNAPICGNGKIEAGEECDDGAAGNADGNRCSSKCLLSGAYSRQLSTLMSNGATCGDGKLQNGQFDSYSWTFTLSDKAQVCQPINFSLNPCPNGVWSLAADASLDSVNVQFYKGANSKNNAACISDAEMSKLSFWQGVLKFLAKAARSFFGFRIAIAADWWCPINSAADGQFAAADLAAMRLGSYKRDASLDGVATEVLGYTADADSYKLNFLRSQNWSVNTQYKAVVNYSKKGIPGVSTAAVTTYDKSCQIQNVRFDVWPRGDSKTSDSFFCASDPLTGKADDCGRYSDSLYDDDMSAPWTEALKGNGYNLGSNGSTAAAALADYKGGNQHLYRVWPIDSHGYALRGTDFSAVVNNAGAETVSAPFDNSDYYKGDFWMTSGFKAGRSMFNVTASDKADPSANSGSGTLPIYTFFCNNPWPDPQNFPFIDSSSNCKSGTGSCINTNFGTYYCRDAGKDKTCDASGNCSLVTADDLPSIAAYDASSKSFSAGAGVVTGNAGDTCANLPSTFNIKFAFYNSADNKAYLWGQDNSIYKGSNAQGWEKVDKGDWQKKGLPGDFLAVAGYSYGSRTYLWDSLGRYYSFDGSQWSPEKKGGLADSYHPTLGYAVRDSSGNDKFIELWDSSGIYKVTTDGGSSWHDGSKSGLGTTFKAVAGYSYPADNSVQIWDAAGNYWNKSNGVSDAGWTSYSNDGLKPSVGFYDGLTVELLQSKKLYVWQAGSGWKAVATTDRSCDNKLKEFLFSGISNSTGTTDAIGLRMYNNNNHYSPELWYKSRFNPSLQGSLSKLSVDGYNAAQEGRTIYVDAADFSDSHGSLYTDMYLLSYNQNASKETENIYGQLVANMFFNAGTLSEGGLEYDGALGYCSLGKATADNMCYSDLDCIKRNAGFCRQDAADATHRADKAKITRDTQRLADVQDIFGSLASYYGKLRCSNDFTRSCKANSDCFGGGACGNFYPNLKAGTYISGKTFSVWPSWQDNLAKELNAKLPVDPINKLWAWDGAKSVDCSDPYNAVTCWDQAKKQMQCNLDYNSAAYSYVSSQSGVSAKIYAKGEEYPTGSNWQPAWQYINNFSANYNPFDGYKSQIEGQQFCASSADTCGNGKIDAGETCSTCPLDAGCGANQSCQKNGANSWSCGPLRACGDGVIQPGEECDDRNGASGDGCDSSCQLESGYRASVFGNALPVCGDGIRTGNEQCEFINGAPTCGTSSSNGALCCTDQCQYASWYTLVSQHPVCGDGLKTDQEECDCGTSGISHLSAALNNPFACSALNSSAKTIYTDNPSSLADYTYCDTNCRRHDKGNYSFCGDNIWDNGSIVSGSNEACDLGTKNGLADSGCTADCKCAAGYACKNGVPSLCGNGKIETGEICDLGTSNGLTGSGCKADCSCDTASGFVCPGGAPTKCGNGTVDAGEVCDKLHDANCNSTCTGAVSGGSCANGCCWKPGDGVCSSACGETQTAANSCSSDCRTCNANDACCNNSTCTWIAAGHQDDDGSTSLCDSSHAHVAGCPPNYLPLQTTYSKISVDGTNPLFQSAAIPSCASIGSVNVNMKVTRTIPPKPDVDIVFVTDLSNSMNPLSVAPYACQGGSTASCTETCRKTGTLSYSYYADCNPNKLGWQIWKPGTSCWDGYADDWWKCSAVPGNNLQAIIKSSIDGLFSGLAGSVSSLHIGLADFATGHSQYGLTLTNSADPLFAQVDKFKTYGGTQTSLGVQDAVTMLSAPELSGHKRIIIIMSDGKNDSGYDPSSILTAAKSAGIQVYSAAFSSDASLVSNMNFWSSNPAGKACGSGYCYSEANTLSNVYSNIISNINSSLSFDAKIAFNWYGGSQTVSLSNNVDQTVSLALPQSACGNPVTFTVSGLSSAAAPATLDLSTSMQYCAPVVIGESAGGPQVAGAYDARTSLGSIWQAVQDFFWRILTTNLIK